MKSNRGYCLLNSGRKLLSSDTVLEAQGEVSCLPFRLRIPTGLFAIVSRVARDVWRITRSAPQSFMILSLRLADQEPEPPDGPGRAVDRNFDRNPIYRVFHIVRSGPCNTGAEPGRTGVGIGLKLLFF
ncbi:hypothetical protein HAX54_033378 [Datura stramonium]|uniref:Uncharacterized protein n=1 Tax=Datura stramonium TaxID=4076 RepID=A0ABS8VFY4_DATST|nr:hypothetical protein [Datura stramonium]